MIEVLASKPKIALRAEPGLTQELDNKIDHCLVNKEEHRQDQEGVPKSTGQGQGHSAR